MTKSYITPASRRLICPKCKNKTMRRTAREGLLERGPFAFLGFFPWECGTCRIRRLFKNRGQRVSRSASEQSDSALEH